MKMIQEFEATKSHIYEGKQDRLRFIYKKLEQGYG
jgi:hypothetical protein